MSSAKRTAELNHLTEELERAAHLVGEKVKEYDGALDGVSLSKARQALFSAQTAHHRVEAKVYEFIDLYEDEL